MRGAVRLMPVRGVLATVALLVTAAAARGQTSAPTTAAAEEPGVKPRLELHVPSLRGLITAARQSNAGDLLKPIGGMLFEAGSASAEGVDVEGVAVLLEQITTWPDAALQAVTYAPDTEGRARWALRLDWPLEDLHSRLHALLASEDGAALFEGVKLAARPNGGYEITMPESVLGYLLPVGETAALLASHADLEFPADIFSGPETEEPPLLACRLNLKGTEKDSGAFFGTSFSAVTDVEYSVRAEPSGDWLERIDVHWPPISGMGAKLVFGRVKQTFFVPRAAFGALALNSLMVPSMLDNVVGFGPQVMMDVPGEMTVVGEAVVGPLAKHADKQACLIVLPGTGFLPMPDVVLQAKGKGVEKFVEDLRTAAGKANKIYRDREQPEPWHETRIRGRTVFFSDGANRYPGALLPVVMRPVIFATQERDSRDRERDFVIVAWTSTDPEDFVRRWLDLPRGEDKLYLPQKRRTNGQLWIHWRQVYRWVHPYVNLGLSAVVRDTLLPQLEQVGPQLTDGLVTAKTLYSGLKLSHRGPLPSGVLVVPTMVAAALAEDMSGGSDLARERSACRRLRVLYHHSKLFKKDLGRWPAEIGELQGYVDFDGNPGLLRLELSERKQLSRWFEGFFDSDEEEHSEDTDDEEEDAELNDDLYVIHWGRDSWTLGFAPDTFEHLEELYIDQDGKIHRTPAKPPAAESQEAQSRPADS